MHSDFLLHPFTLGLALGLFCTILALWRVFTLKLDLRRFKQHLGDRIELEADSVKRAKGELESLRLENERLRIAVARFNEMPEWKAQRDLEIYGRAERRMLLNAPGFAPSWETAKAQAHEELREEEAGKSLPQRVISKLFGLGATRETPKTLDS